MHQVTWNRVMPGDVLRISEGDIRDVRVTNIIGLTENGYELDAYALHEGGENVHIIVKGDHTSKSVTWVHRTIRFEHAMELIQQLGPAVRELDPEDLYGSAVWQELRELEVPEAVEFVVPND